VPVTEAQPQPVIYRKRRNPMARGEREWRVEADALVSVAASGRVRRFRWDQMVSVRLCREPLRARPWRYVFAMQRKDGGRTEIDNAHLVSIGSFEDRSDRFSPFVRAALARIGAANPRARALIGETRKRYFFLLLLSLLGFGALAVTLIVAPTPVDRLAYAAPIKLGIMLLTALIFWRWVMGAMPRGVALDAIPDRALPPPPGSAIPATEVKQT
jgi:hypothetical protein